MHKKGVTCLTGVMISHTVAIFASTSSDGIVLVWKIDLPSTAGGKLIHKNDLIFVWFKIHLFMC